MLVEGSIDFNCDMGESEEFLDNGHDLYLMKYITSVNIACGYHAGSEYLFIKTLENALQNNLKIGAHPGFNDIENFGRKEIHLSENEIFQLVSEQIFFAEKLCRQFGVKLHHVKPHGALYNMAAKNEKYTFSIGNAIKSFDSGLIVYGLAASPNNQIYKNLGLTVFEEGFADRRYISNGSLAPRDLPGSVINDEELLNQQVISFLNNSEIKTLDGSFLKLKIDTLCLHSDTQKSLIFAEIISSIFKNHRLFN